MNTLIECREKRYVFHIHDTLLKIQIIYEICRYNRSEPEHHITFCEEHLYELSYIEYPDDTFLKGNLILV